MQESNWFQLVNKIQMNCQYISLLRPCITDYQKQQAKQLPSTKQTQQILNHNQKLIINYHKFVTLFVELGYFFYSCKKEGCYPQFFEENFKLQQIHNRINIVLYYQLVSESEANYTKTLAQIYNYLLQWEIQFQKKIQQNFHDDIHKKCIVQFGKQLTIIWRYSSLFLDDDRIDFFLHTLQTTKLFNQFSTLLSIKNSSAMNLIKSNQTFFQLFLTMKKQCNRLVEELNIEQKKAKPNQQTLKKKEKELQKNLVDFFEKINAQNAKRDQNKSAQNEETQCKILFTLRSKQPSSLNSVLTKFSGQSVLIQEGICEEKQQSKKQFTIQYNQSKNSITVKLSSQHLLFNIETSDYLMFMSHLLTFHSGTVSIQMVQTQKNGKPGYLICFKGATFATSKQSILEKILLLIDIVMISAKIYQPELVKPNQLLQEHIYRFPTASKKIDHYLRIFLNCAKLIYGA